ncbi:glycosyl hydrolase [Actinomadura craniellae]|uniref:glycosyl hydrolase n=1 Tax=Actinomadura craniellae TaxID=2231787 RepID=UPI0018F2182B|nr:glycosyl hydrolase [Actinomadura craniellae]
MNTEERGFTRRRVLQAGTAAGAGLALTWGTPLNPATADASVPADRFVRPGAAVRPKFRWWWPDGHIDPAEIRREIDQIADAGFGGAEIVAVHHSIRDKSVLDPIKHGWGTPAWNAGVEAALEQAKRRGITVDLTIGPAWPAAVPTLTPDSPAAVKELAYGSAEVAGGTTYGGPVPAAVVAPEHGVTQQKLLLVQAVRLDPALSTKDETGLAADSVQDVTGRVTGDRIEWTAPADGTWLLLAYWERGSGQTPESGPHTSPESSVVDHFSRAGTQAVIDFWESRLLTKNIRRLLKDAGGALFEDSIELETQSLNWTPNLLAEFAQRRGYRLEPYLPVVLRNDEDPVHTYESQLTRHVRHDYWQTVSDLFNEYHFEPLTKWAHSLGLEFRAQPYGLETDSIQSAAIIDIPEGESLGFKNLDDYRALAGGRDMAGRKILSSEAGAYQGGAYNTTWEKLLLTMNGAYAAGLNQTVLHGFSYATAPGVKWPGFAGFTPYNGGIGFSESWGPRHPTWRHVRDVADYFARVHQTTQAGTNKIDVAVFRQKGRSKTGLGAGWFTATGIPLGWTHQLVSAPLLDLPAAKVSGGRLAPHGPAYKLLVVEGDVLGGNECTLPVEVAERLLKLTRAGLPLLFIGDWSAASVPGVARPGENEKLRALLAGLLRQPRVRNVPDRASTPTALADLGLRPDVEHAQSSTLLHARRTDGDTDYYYFSNGKHAETVKPPVAAIDHQVTLTRADRDAVPYRLDPWTGEIERIALYTEDRDRVTLRVALRPGESTVVVLASSRWLKGRPSRDPHATATEAEEIRFGVRGLVIRGSSAGTYATTLSDGRTARTTLGAVPAPIEPAGWTLEVDDFRPGATPTQTEIARVSVTLDALKAWPDIPELADASGVGRYRTTVHLPEWAADHGARLELGEVFDTCRVTVNGHRLPPVDPLNPVVDAGRYLRRGTNTIEVEVATTLNNRLRVADPAVYGGASRQKYGLLGPVRLVPYREAGVQR